MKKTWNYPGSGGQQLAGNELYVYGAGGEVLVEYRSESGEWYGAQTTTSYNVMQGGRAVARRVTGNSEVLGPINRVDVLYRNHLGEVVLNASTPYGQPFGSGGSDQFAGHKEDPETGMKYFGARYYHATSVRWVSADSSTARVYDPLSLNKYAYVRNDPVNLVDPDGRLASTITWGHAADPLAFWWFYDSPSVSFGLGTGWRADQARDAAGSSGASGNKGLWRTTWNYGRYRECREQAALLGMPAGQIPSLEATRWVIDAYLVTKASPDILAAIWSAETDYDMSMLHTDNKDSKGEVWSRDWGPLQINDYWRLDREEWNKLYNPNNDNLKEGGDPFLSLVAGARDLAAHGAGSGDWWRAAAYWHSSKDPGQVIEYVAKVGARQAGLNLFFKCLNKP